MDGRFCPFGYFFMSVQCLHTLQHQICLLTLYKLEIPKWVLWQTVKTPDEMQHKAAFHQGLHCLITLKPHLGTEQHHNF